MKGTFPIAGGRKTFLSAEAGTGGWESCTNKSYDSNPYLAIISSPLTISAPHPLCLVNSSQIYHVSKMCKSFRLWSLLQVFILLWQLLCICQSLRKCVCFSPVNLFYVSLTFRPSQRPEEGGGEFSLTCRVKRPNLVRLGRDLVNLSRNCQIHLQRRIQGEAAQLSGNSKKLYDVFGDPE